MEKKRRRGADSGLIEDPKRKSTCFSKRRNGLFSKSKELCSLHPSISVHAVVFTPAGTPFTFGKPLSLLSDSDQPLCDPDPEYDQISSMLTFDASKLSRAEAEFQMGRLQGLRSTLLSKIRDQEGASSSGLVEDNSYYKFGGEDVADTDFLSLSDFGFESEFEKFREGYNFTGDSDSYIDNNGLQELLHH